MILNRLLSSQTHVIMMSSGRFLVGNLKRVIYTPTQWKLISWITGISGSFSVIGSSLIITMILKGGKERLGRTHNRLLLGMSFIDVFNSVALSLSTIPAPANTSISTAFGNTYTCITQGFFIALGLAVPLYNR